MTLVEPWELAHLGVPHLARASASPRAIACYHMPIRDGDVPDQCFERRWSRASPALREPLASQERLLIHCRAGLGCTGLVAARLLVELGESPSEALNRVRAARAGAVETPAQARYVLQRLWDNQSLP